MTSKFTYLKIWLISFSLFIIASTINAQMLEEIPNPNGFTCDFFNGGENGDLFFDYVDGSYYAQPFYYDGIDLTEVPLPANNLFTNYSNSYNDKFYFFSFDASFQQLLYEFDGSSVVEVTIPAGFEIANYHTNYNDLMYVSLFDQNFNEVLFAYDGNALTEIPNPTDFTFGNYVTTYNDVMYLSYNDINFNSSIFAFDGTNLTPIASPTGLNFPFLVAETDNLIYLAFQDANFNSVLYSFDGNNLTEIPNPSGFSFGFQLGMDGDNLYLGYFDANFYTEIFTFDGTTLTQMPPPLGFDFPQYATSLDGVPYFAFFDNNTFQSFLFLWNGSSFDPIDAPTGFEYSFFADTLNGEGYFIYFDQGFNNQLMQLDALNSEVMSLGSPTGNWTFANYQTSFDGDLFISFFDAAFNQTLFIFNGNDFVEVVNPSGNQLSFFLTEDLGNLYFRYDNFNFQGTLYKLIPNSFPLAEDNTVTTFINIPYFFDENDFNFSDADGDLLEGILITEIEALGNLLADGAHVYVGDHIDTEDISKIAYFPNTSEEGVPYTFFKFKVFDGDAYSEVDYTMFINVVDPATSTKNIVLDAMVKLFPNPTSAFANLTIKAKDDIDELRLYLYSNTGQMIEYQSFNNIGIDFQYQFNVQHLPSGTYFIIGKTDKGDLRKRIVVK